MRYVFNKSACPPPLHIILFLFYWYDSAVKVIWHKCDAWALYYIATLLGNHYILFKQVTMLSERSKEGHLGVGSGLYEVFLALCIRPLKLCESVMNLYGPWAIKNRPILSNLRRFPRIYSDKDNAASCKSLYNHCHPSPPRVQGKQ